jgi:hypothetical protein
MKWLSPIILVAVGVLLLFAGSSAASAEETVASSIGNFIQSKWVAIGLITVGALLFASEEGYLKRLL